MAEGTMPKEIIRYKLSINVSTEEVRLPIANVLPARHAPEQDLEGC
jgi:hypothetical protein